MKTKHETPVASGSIVQPLRTLLVDDSVLLLACLRLLLDRQALVHVVGTAANGNEALQQAELLTPDLVLMDLHMPGVDGLQAAALLRRHLPHARIIIMTLDETVENKAAARAHGAHGFVGKMRLVDDLATEVQRVFRLKHAACRLLERVRGQTPAEAPLR